MEFLPIRSSQVAVSLSYNSIIIKFEFLSILNEKFYIKIGFFTFSFISKDHTYYSPSILIIKYGINLSNKPDSKNISA